MKDKLIEFYRSETGDQDAATAAKFADLVLEVSEKMASGEHADDCPITIAEAGRGTVAPICNCWVEEA